MAAPVEPGIYYITSVEYPAIIVDLYGSQPNGNLIGFSKTPTSNQQWELKYIGASVYTFQAQSASFPYAYTTGDGVKGNPEPTEYILFRVEGTMDVFKIVDSSDFDKGWTLASGNSGTPITLSPDNGSDNQRWTFTPV